MGDDIKSKITDALVKWLNNFGFFALGLIVGFLVGKFVPIAQLFHK